MSTEPGTSATMDIDPLKINEERDNEIGKLMKIVDIIIRKIGSVNSTELLKEIDEGIVDIEASDEIAGVLMTVFTCLQKEENDNAGHLKYKTYLATIMGTQVSIQSIVEDIKKEKIEINFLVATPIVELMTLFKAFFDEVRTGVTRFKVRATVAKKGVKRDASGKVTGWKSTDKELLRTQSISQYGLVNHHIPLLQGITLAPERRTSEVWVL